MTNKEIVLELKEIRFNFNAQLNGTSRFDKAINEAIKILSNSDSDCISRKDAEMCLTANITDMTIEEYISMVGDRIKGLPNIEPKAKVGHWVHGEYCSECGCDVPAYISDWKWQKDMDAKYCPNCGAKMEETEQGLAYTDQDTLQSAT